MKNKKYYIVILLLSAFTSFAQSIVHADDVIAPIQPALLQATAYPTLTPIGATTTPYSVLTPMNFTCPAGVPAGYGTVTPSTDWLYACGQCLPTGTPVTFPTSTAGPTHTPVFTTSTPSCEGECPTPTAIITPTSTSTPTVTNTPVLSDVIWDESVCSADNGSVTCDFISPTLVYVVGNQASSPYPLEIYLEVLNINGTHDVYADIYYDVTFLGFMDSPTSWCFHGWSQSVNCSGSGSHTLLVGYVSGYADNFFSSYFSPNVLGSRAFSGYISIDAPYSVTPTPMVTGTPLSDYCGSLSSSTVPNIFQFGGGNVVYQVCQTTPEIGLSSFLGGAIAFFLPDLVEEIAEIFPIDSVVPPITWCVRSRDYSLYLFGIRMPIELLIGLSIFLGGVRFFVPSAFSGASILGSGTHSNSSTVSSSKVSKNSDDGQSKQKGR